MSLVASVDGVVTVAQALSQAQWVRLQGRVRAGTSAVLLPYCAHRGHLATSSTHTQFFRHYASEVDCEYNGSTESPEHLYAKHVIAHAAREAGWVAQIEASRRGALWRADVLVTREGVRVAFEVQHSYQPADEYLRRHYRYAEDGVRSIWLVDSATSGLARLPEEIEAFAITLGFNVATAHGLGVDGRSDVAVTELIARLLIGQTPRRPARATANRRVHQLAADADSPINFRTFLERNHGRVHETYADTAAPCSRCTAQALIDWDRATLKCVVCGNSQTRGTSRHL